MSSPQIVNDAHLRAVLDDVKIRGPFVNQGWRFHLEVVGAEGWLVWATFDRLDRDSGEMARGTSRKEFLPRGSTVSRTVKTCWVIVELSTRHEAMESFEFEGDRVFDPHHDVEDLAAVNRIAAARRGT